MKRYETIAIVGPDVSPDERVVLFDRCREIINQQNGTILELDEWGTRKLAYEIKKKLRGYYVRFDYCGNGGLVQELERFFRIDERVLKFLTVLLEEDVDPEKISEAMNKTEETVETKSEDSEILAASEDEETESFENMEPETGEEK
ncbi:MAG: 30S ribosomal protein S6 [Desulfobacterales bacterium]